MTAPTPTTHDQGGGSKVGDAAQAAQESAGAVTGSAADHARDLSGSAADKATEVVSEASDKARDLLGQTRDQVQTEAENRRGQAVSTLRSLGDELDSMREHDGDRGFATELAGRGSSYVRQTADWLDGRDPSQILDDVRHFARRRPGTFLVGALVAGVVAGRLTRAVKAGAPETGPSGSASTGGGQHAAAPAAALPPVPAPGPAASSLPGTGDPLLAETRFAGPDGTVVVDDLSPLPNRPGGAL